MFVFYVNVSIRCQIVFYLHFFMNEANVLFFVFGVVFVAFGYHNIQSWLEMRSKSREKSERIWWGFHQISIKIKNISCTFILSSFHSLYLSLYLSLFTKPLWQTSENIYVLVIAQSMPKPNEQNSNGIVNSTGPTYSLKLTKYFIIYSLLKLFF